MKLLEWFAFGGRPRRGRPDPSDLSRRDFFARVTGRQTTVAPRPRSRPRREPSAEPNVLHVFFVEGFPREEVRQLLPALRVGLDLALHRESDQPEEISMLLGENVIGDVAPEISPIVGRMMDDHDPPICRIRSIDPDAPVSRVLQIELLLYEL